MNKNLKSNFPDINPSQDFIESTWLVLKESVQRKSKFRLLYKSLFTNSLLAFSILIFLSSSVLLFKDIVLVNNTNSQVELKLETRTAANLENEINNLFIVNLETYQVTNLEDYTLENNKLSLKLNSGKYKIILSSNKYKNITLYKIIKS